MEGVELVLTGGIGHGIELLFPVLRHPDALRLHGLALGGIALLVGVSNDLCEVLRMNRVQDVEEVLPRWPLALRVPVGEELQHLRVLLELRPESLDGELLVLLDRNLVDLRLLQEVLLSAEDLVEEILGEDIAVGQGEL